MMADWAKLYVTLRDDPKWLRSSDKARVAYVEALCWTAQHETDGALVESLFTPKVLAELVAVGFVDSTPDGPAIHAYEKRQRTKAQLDAVRTAARKANAIRWGSETDSETHSESDSVFHPEVEVEVETEQTKPSKPSSIELDAAFDEFWSAYPRKVEKQAAKRKFKASLRFVPADQIIAGAERYRDDPNRTGEFTKHPTTWLHSGCWDDAPLPPRNGSKPESFVSRALALADRMEAHE